MPNLPIPHGTDFWEQLLLPAVPEFKGAYAEELAFHGDEFLDHLMFSELGRFICDAWRVERALPPNPKQRKRARRSDRSAQIATLTHRAIGALEQGLVRGAHDLQEPIIVSFVENLPHWLDQEELPVFLKFLPPNLMSAHEAIERWRQQPNRTDPSAAYQQIQWAPTSSIREPKRH
jgi:hypothetical protein